MAVGDHFSTFYYLILLTVSCCSETSISNPCFSRSISSCWATSVSLPTCSDIFSTYSFPSGVWFSQIILNTLSGSSGVMEGLVFLPLRVISMNLVLFFLSLSRGNQLLRYFPQTPHLWVTPSESISATLSISWKRMVLEVARGKQYFLISISSLQTVTWASWYRIQLIFKPIINKFKNKIIQLLV